MGLIEAVHHQKADFVVLIDIILSFLDIFNDFLAIGLSLFFEGETSWGDTELDHSLWNQGPKNKINFFFEDGKGSEMLMENKGDPYWRGAFGFIEILQILDWKFDNFDWILRIEFQFLG